MRKLAFICAVLLASMVCSAQEPVKCSCETVIRKDGQKHEDWRKWLDYINIVTPININDYKTIYFFPVDQTNVVYPEPDDNRYPALKEVMFNIQDIFIDKIHSYYRKIKFVPVKEGETVVLDENAVGICIKIEELEMGSRAMRAWVGYGAGAQYATISGVVFDHTGTELFDFRHKRISTSDAKYKKALTQEFETLADDINVLFTAMVDEADKAAKAAAKAAKAAAKQAKNKK